jgi:hypothetical protein
MCQSSLVDVAGRTYRRLDDRHSWHAGGKGNGKVRWRTHAIGEPFHPCNWQEPAQKRTGDLLLTSVYGVWLAASHVPSLAQTAPCALTRVAEVWAVILAVARYGGEDGKGGGWCILLCKAIAQYFGGSSSAKLLLNILVDPPPQSYCSIVLRSCACPICKWCQWGL